MRSVSKSDPGQDTPPPPEWEDEVSTGASVKAITDFDIADTISQRSISAVDSMPKEVWEGGSTSVADFDPKNLSLSAEWNADDEPRARDSELGPELEAPPKREKARYYTRPAEAVPLPAQVTRRKLLRNSAVAAVVGVVGWRAFRRRAAPTPTLTFKPASLSPADFITLSHAFTAILEDPLAAQRTASMADLRMQRLGGGPAGQLASDLKSLEMSSTGVLDGRRFTRLSVPEARAALDAWAGSQLSARRRIRSDLEHLARWCWIAHPATREELGLPPGPT